MEKDFNLRNVVWFAMILVSAGSVYGMLSQKVKALEDNKPFERCFEDEPETFRKKETGNRVLGEVCSWCDFKFSCWEGLEYKPQPVSSAREPRWLYYTHTEDKNNVEEKKS